MRNVQQIVQSENKRKLHTVNAEDTPDVNCNCRQRDNCPVNGQCKTKNVIYQAEVKCDNATQTYIGLTSTDFKTRFHNHKSTFNNSDKRISTELSKHIWSLKDKNKAFEVNWKLVCKAQPYSNLTKKCNLCLPEKYYIICRPSMATLNRRTELISECRHQAKFIVGNVT